MTDTGWNASKNQELSEAVENKKLMLDRALSHLDATISWLDEDFPTWQANRKILLIVRQEIEKDLKSL